MHHGFSAVFERTEESFIGFCPEIPGADGQGRMLEECRENLSQAIALLLECRRNGGMYGIPTNAIVGTVNVEIAQAA